MLSFISQSLTLTLPILAAGIVLIIILKNNYLSTFNKPIDGKYTLRGKPIFGPNKTWRGVAAYSIVAVIVAVLLNALVVTLPLYIHPLFALNPVIIGGAYAGSYIVGELGNSFIKRRIGIKSGKGSSKVQSFFDNVDGMIVVAVVLIVIFVVPVVSVATALLMGFVLHKYTDIIMKELRLK